MFYKHTVTLIALQAARAHVQRKCPNWEVPEELGSARICPFHGCSPVERLVDRAFCCHHLLRVACSSVWTLYSRCACLCAATNHSGLKNFSLGKYHENMFYFWQPTMQQHARCLRRLPRLRDEGCTQLAADVCVFSCVFYWYMWQRKRYIWYIFLVHSLRALAPVRFVSERKIRKRNPASNYFGPWRITRRITIL